jgi:NAD(P)-dependent dehydrogenase (short-subunit alcohol dehydrogenase family)
VGLARSLARELGSRSITVNVVAPGPVETDMTAALGDKRLAEITAAVPLGHGADPDDIAAAVLSLVDARAVTGQMIAVDGGQPSTVFSCGFRLIRGRNARGRYVYDLVVVEASRDRG